MKYRKKPVVIEAIQILTGDEDAKIRQWGRERRWEVYDKLHDTWIKFELGDWIITGIQGETYPCKPDIFAATYEPEPVRKDHAAK